MSLPPTINYPLFNSSCFNSSDGNLTLTIGDQRYLRLGGIRTLSALNVLGNMNCGLLTINGVRPVLVMFLELLLVPPVQARARS
ncbi:hypothetical protein Plhal304r1_c028g0091871 [Plasmopara halstedii]